MNNVTNLFLQNFHILYEQFSKFISAAFMICKQCYELIPYPLYVI